MKPSRELRHVTLGWLQDFASFDGAIVEAFSHSEHVVGFGTDEREFVAGGAHARALLRTQLAQMQEVGPMRIEPGAIHAFEEGGVGWSAVEVSAQTEIASFTLRLTFIWHREEAEWKIVHFHASVGQPNADVWGLELTTAMEEIADIIEQERPDLARVASPEGTLTIMFTDMESSTATNENLGDDRFLPLLLRHNEIVEKHTLAVGGIVVKSQGDGFMLAFSSARSAVECAMCVQRDVTGLSEQLRVRMGLHTGEPVRHADDFYGRDVAYAARLGSAAEGGEILVSALVKALVEPSGSVAFDGPRDFELKGFDGPQPVYAVKW